MPYKWRKGSINLQHASLPTIEKHIAEVKARVKSEEAALAARKAQVGSASSQLREIRPQLVAIDAALKALRGVRQPKDGLIGRFLRLTEQPADVKSKITSLLRQKITLCDRQSELERLGTDVKPLEGSLERKRLWLSKLEEAAARKRRKKDTLIELRAAAASNATETRYVGSAVKRRLIRQPWCPYCGGPLGSDPHADHIYPVSKGGRSVPKNMVYVCAQCNSKKKNMTLTGFIRKFSLDRTAIEDRLEQLHKEF